MEEKPETKSSDYSLEQFRDLFEEIYGREPVPPTQRELVVWTGEAGMDLIHWQMRRAALDNLLDHCTFTEEEKIRIREMIHSEDHDNFTVADALVTENIKQKENGQ